MPDEIHVDNLELAAHIGVPDEERAELQRLTVSLTLEPIRGFANLNDRIENAVDYFIVTRRVQEIAKNRPRHLIETLAEEIATALLREFPLRKVIVELRKYILADARFVSVRLERQQ